MVRTCGVQGPALQSLRSRMMPFRHGIGLLVREQDQLKRVVRQFRSSKTDIENVKVS